MNQWKQLLKPVVFLLVFSILIFLSWSKYLPQFFGIFFGLILFFRIASWWRHSLGEMFDIPLRSFRAWVFSIFWVVVNIGTFAGIGLFFGRLDALTGSLGLFFSGLVAAIFKNYNFTRESRTIEVDIKEERPLDKILVLVYLVLFFIGLNILVHAKTGLVVSTPWQVIPENYLIIYFLATAALLRILFSELSAKATLVLIVFHTFLTVSYLAFTHELFYGADIWRHLATENAIIQSGGWRDAVVTGAQSVFDFGKLSYAQFLSIGVVLNQVFGLDLIFINKWLQPILWAFVFPALMFSFAREMGADKRGGLLAAIFGLLPFALQAAGSFSLPVNFDFLVWLFLVWLLLKFMRERLKIQAIFLITFGALLIFSYSLYFVLFWLLWFVLEIARATGEWSRWKKILTSFGLFLIIAISVPALEIIFNFSHLPQTWNLLSGLKQFFGNLSGWYLAFGPRSHDIVTGNILFNQTPAMAFVPNFLTVDRYWLIAAALVFWLSGLFGLINGLRKKDFRLNSLALLTAGLFLGYFFSRYLMVGDNILARRLKVVLACLSVFFGARFWMGVFLKKQEFFARFRYVGLIMVVIFSAGAITASYSLGPDTKTVSGDEYQAMQYIWQQVSSDNKFCVLGDTYPLLALEAESAKKVVGGGFPIDTNFGQPERVQLFKDLTNRSVENVLTDAKILIDTKSCWLVFSGDNGKVNLRYDKNNIQKVFGDVIIFKN